MRLRHGPVRTYVPRAVIISVAINPDERRPAPALIMLSNVGGDLYCFDSSVATSRPRQPRTGSVAARGGGGGG